MGEFDILTSRLVREINLIEESVSDVESTAVAILTKGSNESRAGHANSLQAFDQILQALGSLRMFLKALERTTHPEGSIEFENASRSLPLVDMRRRLCGVDDSGEDRACVDIF